METEKAGFSYKAFTKKIMRLFVFLFMISGLIAGGAFLWEAETSTLQANYLTQLANELKYEVQPGANSEFYTPKNGPYDIRLGYSRLPSFISRLEKNGFEVTEQARLSPKLYSLVKQGLFMPYQENYKAGINLFDADDHSIYKTQFPGRAYDKFENIPPLVVSSLLFIENRELLDYDNPNKNPAIDWVRIGRALFDKTLQQVWHEHDVPGGSTLATQIEKFRHAKDGITYNMRDKLQQIVSASVRTYTQGENTVQARRNIVMSYLNTVPLSAVSGFGEVNGIGDGLWAWYGLDFDFINQKLQTMGTKNADISEIGFAYKHVLSLMIAQRRPTGYLADDHKMLNKLTNSYLRLLANEGIISNELKDAAVAASLVFRTEPYEEDDTDFSTRKAANAIRNRVASLTGVESLYELDRLDLNVKTTLNKDLQQKVTDILRQLKEPAYAREAGLYGNYLLGKASPDKVIYSFNLMEITPQGIKPRVQADNYDQPFDINQGAKLDLGSTAKLRTLVTYLEIIEKLYKQYSGFPVTKLQSIEVDPNDELSAWLINYLQVYPDMSLQSIIDASLDRVYSASPAEAFYTGGGVQYFKNFKRHDDDKVMTLREATRNSVNLVFIRLMQDITQYYMFQHPGSSAKILNDIDDPRREKYLNRFADMEGKEFLNNFYVKYKSRPAEEALDELFSGIKPNSDNVLAALRYIYPQKNLQELSDLIRLHLPQMKVGNSKKFNYLYENYAPEKLTLMDFGKISGVHPLELWLVKYIVDHPFAGYKDFIRESKNERQEVYTWLQKTTVKDAQDNRIRNLLEVEAFEEIHKSWKRLGYPFDSLVPSLATAIGSSADRPSALAELMGIILNNGVKLPTVMVEELHFAAGTPYETIVKRKPVESEKMFSPEVATALRSVLMDVVNNGTASTIARSIVKKDGMLIPIGGKTGTGDHRYVTFSTPGVIKSSKVVSRSATFVFFIGDRYFGTMTAFVPGEEAGQYRFTSGISVRILKHLLPTLMPLIDTAEDLPELHIKPEIEDNVEMIQAHLGNNLF